MLTKAYYYGRGMGAQASVRRATSGREIGRKIIKKGTSQVGGTGKPKPGGVSLTNEERTMAKKAGMDEAEFKKFKNPLSSLKIF